MIFLEQGQPSYPHTLSNHLGRQTPKQVAALGNLDIGQKASLALFCSVKCPGSLILKSYDLTQQLRQAGLPVAGGFHSPIEKECLTILLRGQGPLLICPARSLDEMRLPVEWQEALQQGRLLLLSPFGEGQRRVTTQRAEVRNRFVAALATHIFVAYAAPDGKTEQFCREMVGWGKPVYTFAHEANSHLIGMGVRGVSKLEELISTDVISLSRPNPQEHYEQ
jgi:predicted Rossmann fold nucleotide-binding protein DprA/Smf involved in DNA uptake